MSHKERALALTQGWAILLALVSACTSGHLSQAQAEAALSSAMDTLLAQGGLSRGAKVLATGVIENDAANTAEADLRFENAEYGCPVFGMAPVPNALNTGKAFFKRYNDKGWVLIGIKASGRYCEPAFSLNVPVR